MVYINLWGFFIKKNNKIQPCGLLPQGCSFLFYTASVFAGGHSHVFFKDKRKGRDGIEEKQIGNFRKGLVFPYQPFRFVDFEFEIGLINALARLFLEEGTQPRRAVVELAAQIGKGEFSVNF